MRKALILAAAAALAVAGQASAHARLVAGSPKAGEAVVAPHELKLHYSESIVPAASSVTVTSASGTAVAVGPLSLDAKDKRIVHAPFASPPPHGAYKVKWHMKTEDGHETDGDFGFTVK